MPTIVPIARLQPPGNAAPVADDGQHSEAWATYHQSVADRVSALPAVIGAQVRKGVTDGSDAAAGDIGEYISASVGPVALTTNTAADVGSISLTAGDWDVWGSVLFTSSGNNLVDVQAWLSNTSATPAEPGRSVILLFVGQMGSGTRLTAGPVRFNVATTTPVYLGTFVTFPAGTAGASGFIGARRAR